MRKHPSGRLAVVASTAATSGLVLLASFSVNGASNHTPLEEGIARGLTQLAQNSSAESLKDRAINEATSATTSMVEERVRELIPTFELSTQVSGGNGPVFGALALIPLLEREDDLVFTQGSVFHADDRTTLNLGLGYRRLLSDERLLLGGNVFYDHEFPYGHRRSSVGLEMRTSVAELNANVYNGLTGWRSGANGLNERAMGGFDIEAGVTLPYMPGVKAYAKHFVWNATGTTADLKGNRFSLAGDVYPGINIEVGRNNYQTAGVQDNNYAQLTLNLVELTNGAAKSRPLFSDTAYRLTSMREHRYDKVRRENIIQKQTSAGTFTATVSGI